MNLAERLGEPGAAYVSEFAARVGARLGDELVGIWLFGSGALGDFFPERSDIDIQAVSAARLPPEDRMELAALLSHDALPCPARGLEFVLYAREDLAAPGGPAFQLNLNSGARMTHQVGLDAEQEPRFWFVIDVSIGRERGIALAGPPAAEVFPEPAKPLVLRSLDAALGWYGVQEGPSAQTVLSACRAWAFVEDGSWRSKSESAQWARGRVRDPRLIDRALELRAGALDRDEVSALVDDIRARVAAAIDQASA